MVAQAASLTCLLRHITVKVPISKLGVWVATALSGQRTAFFWLDRMPVLEYTKIQSTKYVFCRDANIRNSISNGQKNESAETFT